MVDDPIFIVFDIAAVVVLAWWLFGSLAPTHHFVGQWRWRSALLGALGLSLAAIYFVLTTWASFDVVDSTFYIVGYLSLGLDLDLDSVARLPRVVRLDQARAVREPDVCPLREHRRAIAAGHRGWRVGARLEEQRPQRRRRGNRNCVVVDLPGERAIEVGAALAAHGFAPIVLFNGVASGGTAVLNHDEAIKSLIRSQDQEHGQRRAQRRRVLHPAPVGAGSALSHGGRQDADEDYRARTPGGDARAEGRVSAFQRLIQDLMRPSAIDEPRIAA